MSVTYYFKKGFSTVFNDNSVVKACAAAAFIAAPAYIAGDLINPDPSVERAAVSGERQAQNLDKALTVLLTLKKQGDEGQRALLDMEQERLLRPEDKELERRLEEQASRQRKMAEDVSVQGGRFMTQMLLSEDISEKDALGFATRYRAALGGDPLYQFNDSSMSGAFGHLDACQRKTLAHDINPGNGAAADIAFCMAIQRNKREFLTMFGGMFAGMGGLAVYGFGLVPLARRYRREIKNEEYLRSEERRRRAREKEQGVRSEEVKLTLRITKPR